MIEWILNGTLVMSPALFFFVCAFSAITGALIANMDTDRQEKRMVRHVRRMERKIDTLLAVERGRSVEKPIKKRPPPPLVLTRTTTIPGVIETRASGGSSCPQRVGDRPAFRARLSEITTAGPA